MTTDTPSKHSEFVFYYHTIGLSMQHESAGRLTDVSSFRNDKLRLDSETYQPTRDNARHGGMIKTLGEGFESILAITMCLALALGAIALTVMLATVFYTSLIRYNSIDIVRMLGM